MPPRNEEEIRRHGGDDEEMAVVHHAEGVKWCAPVAVRYACCLLKVPGAIGCDVCEIDLDVLVPVLAVVLVSYT